MSSFVTATIIVSSLLGQAEGTPSNAEHLAEYGRLFAGKWIGEWEMDFTIPGIVEKGDKVVLRTTTQWILNKNALETEWDADVNGKSLGGGKSTVGWDAQAQEIVTYGFNTFGGSDNTVYTKLGESWVEMGSGMDHEGKKHPIVNIITFSEDGSTQKVVVSGRVDPDGKPMDNFTIIYKKQE